ncbi:MAG TPA: HipA family kinase [Polyangiaceae bacterium]|nr:HipA family kinase [Polyangiaceae bacterium]
MFASPAVLRSHAVVQVRARLVGSSSPVLVETEAGLFVAKLRGAGQGVAALIAEIIVGEIATTLGLPVPERSLLTVPQGIESLDKNDELAQLLEYSVGLNLGVRYLDGAEAPRQSQLEQLDDDFVARVLWLDGLTENPDRTTKNPNLLLWHGRPWLIDHGAALTFQYGADAITEDSPREPTDFSPHVFGARTAVLARYDAELAALVDAGSLSRATSAVPDAFLVDAGLETSPHKTRALYHAFLWKRLKPPRPFVP